MSMAQYSSVLQNAARPFAHLKDYPCDLCGHFMRNFHPDIKAAFEELYDDHAEPHDHNGCEVNCLCAHLINSGSTLVMSSNFTASFCWVDIPCSNCLAAINQFSKKFHLPSLTAIITGDQLTQILMHLKSGALISTAYFERHRSKFIALPTSEGGVRCKLGICNTHK